MIRTVTNDTVSSRIDMQVGRRGLTRRVSRIHVQHTGPEDSGEILVDIQPENGNPVRLILQPGAARQLAEWLHDQAV